MDRDDDASGGNSTASQAQWKHGSNGPYDAAAAVPSPEDEEEVCASALLSLEGSFPDSQGSPFVG